MYRFIVADTAYSNYFKFTAPFTESLVNALEAENVKTFVPPIYGEGFNLTPEAFKNDDEAKNKVTWSSRNACYAAGLGTFGIHKHIITEKGCCGAIISLFVDCELEPAERKYTGVYDYCIKCGACVKRCPVNAISIKYLRNPKNAANIPSISAKNLTAACAASV